MNNWIIYILRCRNGSLYTGITKDLERRVDQHNAGTGAKYTNANRPCKLVWSQNGFSESGAKKEEARIKKMTKKEKEDFITSK
ncbi:MAG: GIY-YIG nuclease family protein [Patescibacteria group bacterium]